MVGSGGTEVKPSALNNNDWFSTTVRYGFSTDGKSFSNYTVAGAQAHLGSSIASGNIDGVDPKFASNAPDIQGADWALTAATPSAVYQGGKNLSSLFSDDKTGSPRPSTGWSIGAYQYP